METAVKRNRLLMQAEFQSPLPPPLSGGEASSAVHAAYMSGLCAGLSFRSILAYGSLDSVVEAPLVHNLPRPELLFTENAAEAPPFNFFPEAGIPSHHYQQLPELLSLEPPPDYTTGSDCNNLLPNHQSGTMSYGMPKRKPRKRKSDQKLSEKTRCLQKLLPWNKQKVDMATTLEEAYKYIKFLQAQTSVLQAMPAFASSGDGASDESGGDLERMNRQQLLQVVLNSPVAQTQLYSQGCCIYPMEQLVLLKKNAERKALFHQMLLDANPNSIMY